MPERQRIYSIAFLSQFSASIPCFCTTLCLSTRRIYSHPAFGFNSFLFLTPGIFTTWSKKIITIKIFVYRHRVVTTEALGPLTRDHTVLPATHTLIHKWNEPPCFFSQPQSITALWSVLIFRPTEGRRLS